jgi:hypothetical protein
MLEMLYTSLLTRCVTELLLFITMTSFLVENDVDLKVQEWMYQTGCSCFGFPGMRKQLLWRQQ